MSVKFIRKKKFDYIKKLIENFVYRKYLIKKEKILKKQ